VGDDGHQVLVGEPGGIEEGDHHAPPVELLHVEEPRVGAPPAARAEDPRAEGERLDLRGGDGAEGAHALDPSLRSKVMTSRQSSSTLVSPNAGIVKGRRARYARCDLDERLNESVVHLRALPSRLPGCITRATCVAWRASGHPIPLERFQ